MPTKPEFHTLAEFRKLSGSFKKPIVIYFNEKQLANLNASASAKTGKPPTKTLSLTVSQIDGVLGGFVTAKCPETPTKIGSGELRCGSAPSIPSGPGGGEIEIEACFLSFGANGSVRCRGRCRRGACTLGRWRLPGSNIVTFTCSCR
jgi:hypothetical protein